VPGDGSLGYRKRWFFLGNLSRTSDVWSESGRKTVVEVSTESLYFKYQELQTLLAIADQVAMTFVLPCEVSDDELLIAGDVLTYLNEYRADLRQRASWINRTIQLRLESKVNE